ncbi:MAG TPA: GGDEF domain-containing protein [Sphingobium sp.]|uniref:GGDEF domain-containing protein n=1 Tax=Sphingobium sp. TaxID=1912891 RepID=UPI002ED6B713
MRTVSCAGSPVATVLDRQDLEDELQALRKEVAMLRLVNAELERVVVRDTLTPLYNRRYYISALNDRIHRSSRHGAEAVAIIIDVNHMKRINDVHGHPAGDYALMHVAKLLSQAIRSTDIAARIGGDEFALILDGMNADRGAAKIASLEWLIQETPCLFGDAELPISASFGCTPISADDSDATIIARADEAMYEQKRIRRFGS